MRIQNALGSTSSTPVRLSQGEIKRLGLDPARRYVVFDRKLYVAEDFEAWAQRRPEWVPLGSHI